MRADAYARLSRWLRAYVFRLTRTTTAAVPRLRHASDGLSQTLLLSEVKNYQNYLRDCGGLSLINNADSIPPANAEPLAVVPEYAGASCTPKPDAHAEWVDGGVHHTGFTTAWPPNKTIGNASVADLDINGEREKVGGPTFAAVTSRSYHRRGEHIARRWQRTLR